MTDSKHTPGPWEIRKAKHPVDGAYDWAIGAEVDGGGPYCIAEAFGRADQSVFLPAEANARLIAAAPELLEALEKIASGDGVYGAQAHEYKQIARAAIAKARGQS